MRSKLTPGIHEHHRYMGAMLNRACTKKKLEFSKIMCGKWALALEFMGDLGSVIFMCTVDLEANFLNIMKFRIWCMNDVHVMQ